LAEIVGAWEVVSAPPPPQDPYGGSYFVIGQDGVLGWVRGKTKLDRASGTLLRDMIDTAGRRGDESERWLAFDFSDGEVVVHFEDGQEAHRHLFRTAIVAARQAAFPAAMELQPGDIVWTQILPDPNNPRRTAPPTVTPPPTVHPPDIAQAATIEPPARIELPQGYDPFADVASPRLDPPRPPVLPPVPSWGELGPPRRLISPQPRREYRLRRLPEA